MTDYILIVVVCCGPCALIFAQWIDLPQETKDFVRPLSNDIKFMLLVLADVLLSRIWYVFKTSDRDGEQTHRKEVRTFVECSITICSW